MKTKVIFTIILTVLLMASGIAVIVVNAGFSMELLSNDNQDEIIMKLNIRPLSEQPQKEAIECFDVSEDGTIAIGSSSSNGKTITILSNEGTFEYGYSFNCDGKFGVEWDEENIFIYLVRSDIAVSVNPSGQVESVLKIKNSTENGRYWRYSIFSTTRIVDNTVYALKNDMGLLDYSASSYSQLTASKNNGEIRIIYDVNSYQIFKSVTILGFLSVFVCFVLFAIIKVIIKLNQET